MNKNSTYSKKTTLAPNLSYHKKTLVIKFKLDEMKNIERKGTKRSVLSVRILIK